MNMLRDLRREYGTVRSPWAEYATYSFPDASLVSQGERQSLMDAMNNIIAINWKATEPHWTADSSPFDSKFSLILVYRPFRTGGVFGVPHAAGRRQARQSTGAVPKCFRPIRVEACTGFSPPKS